MVIIIVMVMVINIIIKLSYHVETSWSLMLLSRQAMIEEMEEHDAREAKERILNRNEVNCFVFSIWIWVWSDFPE